jgi:16S rRNA (uracil1498-N3)-methyltransferase
VAAPRIFTAQPLQARTSLQLDEAPARHVAGVLRLKTSAEIVLFNGDGGEYPATLTAVDRKRVDLQLGEHRAVERETPLAVHLGIALSRGERMDWIVQKSTELGVSDITLLDSERCGVKLKGERAGKKLAHFEKIAISACEQCGRNTLPRIHPLQSAADWTISVQAELKLVLHHRSSGALAELEKPQSVALLVGPEGGLSDGEICTAENNGFRSLVLGPRVMRTETAPLAAQAILQAQWGDMG